MSAFSSPTDVLPVTKALSVTINNLDAAIASAFALLPDEVKLATGAFNFALDTGTVNTYLVQHPQTVTAYADGFEINFIPLVTNNGASTINVSGIGVKSIRKMDNSVLDSGDIRLGIPASARYSTVTGFFHLTSQSPNVSSSSATVPQATEIIPGKAEIATQTETDAGVSDSVIITPLKLSTRLAYQSLGPQFINGNFDVWDYATAQTSSGYGSDNRWANLNNGTTKNSQRIAFTEGITSPPFSPKYYNQIAVTSVAGSGNYCSKSQRIEGVNSYAGETVTIHFWANTDSPRNIAIELLQDFGSGGSAQVTGIGAQKTALTTAWALYKATITIPSISGKTIGTSDFLAFNIFMDAGSDFNSRTATLGQQSGTFRFASIQIDRGTVALPFRIVPLQQTIDLCERYAPIFNDYDGGNIVGMAYSTSATAMGGIQTFRVRPRVPPTGLTVSSSAHFTFSSVTVQVMSAITFSNSRGHNAGVYSATISGATAGWGGFVRSNTAGAQIIWTGCEL